MTDAGFKLAICLVLIALAAMLAARVMGPPR